MSRKILFALSSLLLAHTACAAPVFVNGLAIPGNTPDRFGSDVNDGRIGFFSDIYYDRDRNEWWGLSDRGPGGGTLDYDTRVQRFTLKINPVSGAISNFRVVQTIKFSRSRQPMNGKAPDPSDILGNALDPEGFVVVPRTGNFLVSDEYGPSLYEFNRAGQFVRAFKTPANLVPRDSVTGIPSYAADPATNPAGKRTNRGFEGLAVSPDGRFVYAMLQSAILDEGGGNGTLNRIVKFEFKTGKAVAQYAYEMKRSGQGQGISALLAVNDHEFLVLERNNRGVGVGAAFATADKEVYRIDVTGATDVSTIDLDAPGVVFAKVVKSAPVLDLDANTIDLDGDGDAEDAGKSPEKWEGLTVGPKLKDGSYLMLAGTDNDYSVTQNADGNQFDVYFDFNLPDPYAASIQCPLDAIAGCVRTSDGSPVELGAQFRLLPGVLHAYKFAPADLAGYVPPKCR